MNDSPLILMLEDETERLDRFVAVLSAQDRDIELRHWRTANEFIAGFENRGRTPALICLDHDLFTESPDDPDPGDGRDVAEFLARSSPCCHIIIHSSNQPAADSMYFTLQDAKWDVEKIAPLGDAWIEEYWWVTARPFLFK